MSVKWEVAWLVLLAAVAGCTADGGATHAEAWPDARASVLERVRARVQPLLDEMAQKHNTSFSFGFATADGTVALAAGVNNIWTRETLKPETPIPLGSVTKTFTALRVMQAVEKGQLSLDDPASKWIDPALRRMFNPAIDQPPPHGKDASLVGLWGPQAGLVTVGDLLSMSSGFGDYNDTEIMDWTLHHGGDDMPPWAYLVSASRKGFLCAPHTCASYSGANYVLLGFVLVELAGVWSWQDFDQASVFPRALREAGRYRSTTFPKLGRCSQYPGIAHQYAFYKDPRYTLPHMFFNDLENDSCLNGWTMGNIASTGGDLASFFYDVFALAPTGKGYVNSTTLATMMKWHSLQDKWCMGPRGPGSCQYGMGFFKNQFGQDVFFMRDWKADRAAVRVSGHPGEDWGSGCLPCGYNERYKFGVCIARTSPIGMNCSNPWHINMLAPFEAPCKLYDAVLAEFGAPRLRCPDLPTIGLRVNCEWGNATPEVLATRRFGGAWMAGQQVSGSELLRQLEGLHEGFQTLV